MVDLPSSLIDAVREQRAVLFLGAGASYGAEHPNGLNVPTADKLRDMICEKFLGGELKDRSLAAVAEFAQSENGLNTLQRFIYETFEPFSPAEFHKLVRLFRWRAIATTNYDVITERAFEENGSLQTLVKLVKDGVTYDAILRQNINSLEYIKLHGCIEHYTDQSIPFVLSNEQYARYEKNRLRLYGRLRDMAHEYPIIFCGYKIEDPHIQKIIFDIADNEISRPAYFNISPGLKDREMRYWQTRRVTCVRATYEEFLRAVYAAIPQGGAGIPIQTGGGQLSIRTHYKVANAPESSALASFLEVDATHVRPGMPIDGQEAASFYKGYDTGWGCIAQDLDVRRSISDSILVDAILLDEGSRKFAELFVAKGPAGNGKTVCLKRIAWEAASSYEKLVLFFHPDGALRRNTIEEIYRLTGKRIYIFVDKLALARDQIIEVLNYCSSNRIEITIVGGERESEWNTHCTQLEKFVRQDFQIRYLNENEIKELLVLLERHNALGLLSEKSPEQRVDAFVQRAQRQLLVALHEATMGIPFEDIIFDEYTRIEPSEAKRLYLDICSLHQFGAPVRAGLISRATGIEFREFSEKFVEPLEKMVFVREDKYSGDYYYVTRHEHIAEMVFNRVLTDPEEKYDHLVGLMGCMNPDYSSDSETFKRLMRGRAVADIFLSVDLGRLFYEEALRVSGQDPFTLQQYAIFEMSHSGGSLERAERFVQQALSILPNSNIINHTLAEVARKQASTTEDSLKKEAYRRTAYETLTRSTETSSEYSLRTRALLAIDELRELLSEQSIEGDRQADRRILDLTRTAETSIQKGLQIDPDSPNVLSIEATLRDLLDEHERAIQALEKAFGANPRQDWLAIRLSKKYLAAGDFERASSVVQKCLGSNPSSKIAHLEQAMLLMRSDLEDPLILDHLRSSFSDGDGNYDAQFWYARELYRRKYYDQADKFFGQINDRAPSDFRGRSGAALVQSDGARIRFTGRIDRKEEGYAFVRFNAFPDAVFASRSETEDRQWNELAAGQSVVGEVEFNRRGPRAVNLLTGG